MVLIIDLEKSHVATDAGVRVVSNKSSNDEHVDLLVKYVETQKQEVKSLHFIVKTAHCPPHGQHKTKSLTRFVGSVVARGTHDVTVLM